MRRGAWVTALLFVAVVAAIALPFFAWSKWGGQATWPGLIGNFTATLAAFVLALAHDRRTRRAEAEQAAKALYARRQTEARRRLLALHAELTALKGSVQSILRDHAKAAYFLPDLPSGSWEAGRERLGVILADYRLMADLSTLYGRIDDLRWRLRFKAQLASRDQDEVVRFNTMIEAIGGEAVRDLERLLPDVKRQADSPDVEELGVIHRVSVGAAIEGSSAVSVDLTVDRDDSPAAGP